MAQSARNLAIITSITFIGASSMNARAQQLVLPAPPKPPVPGLEELARKAQNPLSDLTSALLENNFGFGFGLSNGLQYNANLEEIYPVRLVDQLGLVQRFIVPFIAQPETVPGQGSNGGLGDIQYQAYFTSVNQTGFIFGLGPIVSIPSAYPHELGSGKWSAGPTASAVAVVGDWVAGVQVNQLWSISSYNDRPSVSQMQLQPFINLNLQSQFLGAWYLTSSPLMTANWKAGIHDRWTVPLGGGVGKVFRISKQAVKTELQAFDALISPNQGPDWSIRLQFQFLFPSQKENKSSL
ncbi:MAG: hypothetical protein ACJ763_15780 [Bdellovibrionia bacterium]